MTISHLCVCELTENADDMHDPWVAHHALIAEFGRTVDDTRVYLVQRRRKRQLGGGQAFEDLQMKCWRGPVYDDEFVCPFAFSKATDWHEVSLHEEKERAA